MVETAPSSTIASPSHAEHGHRSRVTAAVALTSLVAVGGVALDP